MHFCYNRNYKSLNFEKCTKGLFSQKKNVGFNATRNIFNSDRKYYDAYIYHFDFSSLPNCVDLG